MSILYKKIKYLSLKRKYLNWLYVLTFGIAWAAPIILFNFYSAILHWLAAFIYIGFNILGYLLFENNRDYWDKGFGDKVISFNHTGILTYLDLFCAEGIPIIPWDEIWGYELLEENGSTFVILTSDSLTSEDQSEKLWGR